MLLTQVYCLRSFWTFQFPWQENRTAEWDVSKDPMVGLWSCPYEDPEIAVAVFIEQAGSGGERADLLQSHI